MERTLTFNCHSKSFAMTGWRIGYIGGPKQYQVYQQFRQKQKMNSESYVATPDSVTVVEINAMNWGEWDGWGPDGLLGEPGWY